MEFSIPLFIPLLNKGDAIATPVTHFCLCIDSALFSLCRFYCGHCLTWYCRLSKSNPFIVVLLHFWALNNLGQKNNHPLELVWSKKNLPMKTSSKSFPLNSHFVAFSPKIPTNPKPSHSSELIKPHQYAIQLWNSLALAHFQQNSMLLIGS